MDRIDRCPDCLMFRQSIDRFIGSAEATNRAVSQSVGEIKENLDKVIDRYAEVDSNISMLTVKLDGVIEDVAEIKRRTSGKGYPAITHELLKREEDKKFVDDITGRIELGLLKKEKTQVESRIQFEKKWYDFIPIITSLAILLSILIGLGFYVFRGPASMDPGTVETIKDLIKKNNKPYHEDNVRKLENGK